MKLPALNTERVSHQASSVPLSRFGTPAPPGEATLWEEPSTRPDGAWPWGCHRQLCGRAHL